MKEVTIKAKKQKNGLWGHPHNLGYIDRITWENQLLQSAIIMAVSEQYPDEHFGIYFSSEKGFNIQLSKSGWKRIDYSDYSLNDNILTYDNSRNRTQT